MNFTDFFSNTKSLMKLTYPILIAQLIQVLMGFADTVMAGRVSATDMAAVAVASSVWLPLIIAISGLIMALASIVSQLSGAKQYSEVAKASYQTAWIALFFSTLIIVLYYVISPVLINSVSLEPELKRLMFEYLEFIVWGGPGYCLYLVLRNYSEGLSHSRPTMIISVLGLMINIPANYIFIYGEFGVPAMGGAGCGIATAIVYWVMFLGMLAYSYFSKHLKHAPVFNHFYWPNWQQIKSILSLGIPIAFSLLFEVSLFAAIAILLAPFGANIVASHQIAINFSSLVFMVPLSLAMAVTIKVGFEVGNNNLEKAKERCQYSILLGLFLAVGTAAITILFNHQIAAIYSTDQDVLTLAANLMLLASLFQFSDSIQVITTGALRGYKDTKSILLITFFSYWVIGLSLGVILGITDWIVPAIGAYGFWIGVIAGLTVAAILLTVRLKVVQKRFDEQAGLPQ